MIIIFAYHSVSDTAYRYAVSPQAFTRQMRYLKKHFTVVSIDALPVLLAEPHKHKKPIAVITFDDGLKDNYTAAYPILKDLNIPATIFVATKYIGGSVDNASGYHFDFMSADDIRVISQDPLITIGSHTHAHLLATEVSLGTFTDDCMRANTILQDLTSKSVDYFAYPKGRTTSETIAALRGIYRLSFTTTGRIVGREHIDIAAVPRYIVYNTSFFRHIINTLPLVQKIRFALHT